MAKLTLTTHRDQVQLIDESLGKLTIIIAAAHRVGRRYTFCSEANWDAEIEAAQDGIAPNGWFATSQEAVAAALAVYTKQVEDLQAAFEAGYPTQKPVAPAPATAAKIAPATFVALVPTALRGVFATDEITMRNKAFFIGYKHVGTYSEALNDFTAYVFGYPILDKTNTPAHFLNLTHAARAAAEAYAACVALERIFALATDAYDETVAEQEQYMQYEAELEEAFLDNGEL